MPPQYRLARFFWLANKARRVLQREGVGQVVRIGIAWLHGGQGNRDIQTILTRSSARRDWLADLYPGDIPAEQRAIAHLQVDGARLNIAATPARYANFVRQTEPTPATLREQRNTPATELSVFRIITLVTNAEGAHLPDEHAVALQQQTYPPSHTHLLDLFSGEHKSGQSVEALFDPTDDPANEWLLFLDARDLLASHALYAFAEAIRAHPQAVWVYGDEDAILPGGKRGQPFFKPNFSPEMLFSSDYAAFPAAYRRDWFEANGGQAIVENGDTLSLWRLALHLSARVQKPEQVAHVPGVLLHRRSQPADEPPTRPTIASMLAEHLAAQGIDTPQVTFPAYSTAGKLIPQVAWTPHTGKVSIIIPSKDKPDLIGLCLRSLFSLTTYRDFEVIIVDSGSVQAETRAIYAQFQQDARFRVVQYDPAPAFNFSRACNLGATAARGEAFLFLNNDVEIIQPDWIERLAQWLDIPRVGIVGARLLLPDQTPDGSCLLQHNGIAVGLGNIAGHLFYARPEHTLTLLGHTDLVRNVSAVTAACLLIRRTVFERIGGFDEGYTLDYGDVALCLRAWTAGYRIVCTPGVRAVHHEGVSRGSRHYRADFEQVATWEAHLRLGDPYLNPNLDPRTAFAALKTESVSDAWTRYKALMARIPPGETFRIPDDVVLTT